VKKPFTIIAIALLSLVAVVQLLRFSFGWEVTIDGVTVPVWVSAIAFVIAGGLALMMWKETRA
jgi:hypothetical protein